MRTFACLLLPALALGLQVTVAAQRTASPPPAPKTPRLYVFDCGLINVNRAGTERYKVTPEEGNANLFAGSTWLARPAERTFMWEEGNTRVNRTFFESIKTSKSISLDRDEYDVFGDSTVVLKAAPGHSPGHQVLVLNLPRTGRVMIAGDLYHYPQERTLKRPPPDTEFNVEQSAASRVMIEEYLRKTKTEIWIEHDFVHNAILKKSPQFYD
jgi:glyoxylase-like metal-dependent hydrolase (beta-lactamase superfamily II)